MIRAHQEALLAGDFIAVLSGLSLVAARERARCVIRWRRFVCAALLCHPVADIAAQRGHGSPSSTGVPDSQPGAQHSSAPPRTPQGACVELLVLLTTAVDLLVALLY